MSLTLSKKSLGRWIPRYFLLSSKKWRGILSLQHSTAVRMPSRNQRGSSKCVRRTSTYLSFNWLSQQSSRSILTLSNLWCPSPFHTMTIRWHYPRSRAISYRISPTSRGTLTRWINLLTSVTYHKKQTSTELSCSVRRRRRLPSSKFSQQSSGTGSASALSTQIPQLTF